MEEEKRARAEKKATEKRRKEIEALRNDEKVKAAMAEAFPSEDQLKKDLMPLTWDNLENDSIQFIKVKGRAIVGIKTEAGHRLGAYFHHVEREFRGEKMNMVVKTSRFYTLDNIEKDEALTYSFAGQESSLGTGFLSFQEHEKGSFFDLGPFFVLQFVDIP